MGGSTTSVSVYQDGRLVFADVIPIGGQHITNDIARGLATPVAHAERLKTLHGSAIPTLADERELVAVPLMGERGVDTIHKVPRSKLVSIIRPRLEETFELVRDRLAASAFGEIASRRLVLSGGASQLTGVRELASEILSRHARAGFPRPLRAMPQTAHSPAFSVAAGLLDFALKPDVRLVPGVAGGKRQGRDNYLLRVGRWITESF
jgi:cell division protein FtsA